MVVVVCVVVIVGVGADLSIVSLSGGTGVLWRGFVGQLGQSSLELSADADVLIETWDLNIQLRPLLFLFLLFFTLTAVYKHGSVGESLLVLVGNWPRWSDRSLRGFLGLYLHG